MLLLGLIGFVLVGISLGMLGGGGSILAVPVLVHVLHLPANEAVRMSLPVVGLASAVGAWRRWKLGQLRLGTVAIFAAGTMIASFIAARLGADIPDRPRLLLFTAVLLIAAALMWRRAMRGGHQPDPVETAPTSRSGTAGVLRLFVTALGIGTLTGILGVGGGFLMVPALVAVVGLAMAEATATSLAVIALNTGAASAGWWGAASIDLELMLLVTAAAMAGILLGTWIAPKVSTRNLVKAFAVLLVVVGVFMLVKEL